MTGYVFLVFEEEMAVQRLLHDCHFEDDRYFLFVSSPTMRNKPVQVWNQVRLLLLLGSSLEAD